MDFACTYPRRQRSTLHLLKRYSTKCKSYWMGLICILLFVFFLMLFSYMVISFKSWVETSNSARTSRKSYRSSGSYPLLLKNPLTQARNSIRDRRLYTPDHLKAPAILLNPSGRLGNQLFQYACHYSLARKYNIPLYIMIPGGQELKYDLKDSSLQVTSKPHPNFLLHYFNIPLYKFNIFTGSIENRRDVYFLNDSEILSGNLPTGSYILSQSPASYCQSENYFSAYRDEILELFTLRKWSNNSSNDTKDLGDKGRGDFFDKWSSMIDNAGTSVAIHIRQTDFVTLNATVPFEFYRDAMQRISTMLGTIPTFFIFSDDTAAAAELVESLDSELVVHIVSLSYYIGEEHNLEEFQLMSSCQHFIIPASTFSWWAAYLSPSLPRTRRIVIPALVSPNYVKITAKDNDNPEHLQFMLWFYANMFYPADWFPLDLFSPNYGKE